MIKNKIKKRVLQEISYATGRYFLSPEIVSLVVTYKCNFRCKACTVWRMHDYPELSQKEWEKISEQFARELSPETSIEISGGEPLIRKELVIGMIKHLKKFFKNVGINSNGSMLDEKTANVLKENGISFVKISLYSFDNAVHDDLRGIPGAAEHAKKAIALLQKNGIRTDVGVLITSKNIPSLPALIEHYSKPEYSNISIVLQPLDEPIGEQPAEGKDKISTIENLWPDEKQIEEFFSWLRKNKTQKIKNSEASMNAIEKYYLDQKSALNRRCLAGQRSLVIHPDGNLAFCYKGDIVGNVVKDRLQNILLGKKALEERKNMKKCGKFCRIIGCNFSRTIREIF